jgi:hypothetical protein
MPSGVRSLYDEELSAASSIIAEVQGEVNKANDGASPKANKAASPKAMAFSVYVSGALVAMVAGMAVGL